MKKNFKNYFTLFVLFLLFGFNEIYAKDYSFTDYVHNFV